MSIKNSQSIFVKNIGLLIEWAYSQGYELTFGESYNAQGTGHMKNSLHYQRLAQDFNLFIDGEYKTDTESYRRLGEAWKAFHKDNRWGGDFRSGDGNHFSMGIGDGRA
jgi:hypothetical protein